MKKGWIRAKKALAAVLTFLLVFGIAAAVLAYVLGYYDIVMPWQRMSDAAKLRQTMALTDTPVIPHAKGETGTAGELAEAEPFSVRFEEGENAALRPHEAFETKSTAHLYDPARLMNKPAAKSTVAEAERGGYIPADDADGYDPETGMLARIEPETPLPDAYAYRTRYVREKNVIVPTNNTENTVEETIVSRVVPAIELYMGYMLLDGPDGGERTMLSSDGRTLCLFRGSVYALVYQRDRDGNPLFSRKAADGSDVYFTLSPDGGTFIPSDYDPATDSRGLTFDYPAHWGVTETDGLAALPGEDGKYAYFTVDEDGNPTGRTTAYRFTTAHPYDDGLAAVTTDENRGAYYFIGRSGQKAFETIFTYDNEYGRSVEETLLAPLTDGIESIGFFYFDHGYTRVRRQVIDYYQYYLYHLTRVVTDEDALIDAEGGRYPLPMGYRLTAYSDGVLRLENEKTGLCGFMTVEGDWIAQPIYASAMPFVEGLAALTLPDGRVGMIDRAGGIVLPFAYEHISNVSSGVVAAFSPVDGWSVYRIMKPAD